MVALNKLMDHMGIEPTGSHAMSARTRRSDLLEMKPKNIILEDTTGQRRSSYLLPSRPKTDEDGLLNEPFGLGLDKQGKWERNDEERGKKEEDTGPQVVRSWSSEVWLQLFSYFSLKSTFKFISFFFITKN